METETVYSTKIVDKLVWLLPPINCKENNYPTKIGGMLPNELAVLYAEMYFDYDDCTDAYWKAQQWIEDRNKHPFNNQKG